MTNNPCISFIIVARNAELHIAESLKCFFAQDFPAQRMELIVVDGNSSDRTLEIAREQISTHSDIDCFILDNPDRTLSAGWNLALAKARHDVIMRVDAHATFHPDFIRRNMDLIAEGHMIVGGHRETVPRDGRHGLLYAAETSRFGAGASGYRNPGPRRHVDTIGHAAYQRTVYETVGGYDERLVRNQDIEIHIRMRKAGFEFLFDPSIISRHAVRPTLRTFLKQKYLNGFWVATTLATVDRYPFYRHFAPLALVLGLIATSALSVLLGVWWPLASLAVVYALPALIFSAIAGKTLDKTRLIALPLLPFTFAALHLCYGIGSLVGLLGIPLFRYRNRGYAVDFPIEPDNG